MPPRPPEMPIIACPLEFERRALHARIGDRCEVHRCGPGADAMARWTASIGRTERPVVLAGLAGALNPALKAGAARSVTEVRAEDGTCWRPPLLTHDTAATTIMTRREVVATPDAKRAAWDQHRVDLVDQEAAAFAAHATALGWRWGIVRGISDDAAMTLPEGIADWVGADGRTRLPKVIAFLLRHPRALKSLRRLRRHSTVALEAVAQIVLHELVE